MGLQFDVKDPLCEVCKNDKNRTRFTTRVCVTNLGNITYVCEECFELCKIVFKENELLKK